MILISHIEGKLGGTSRRPEPIFCMCFRSTDTVIMSNMACIAIHCTGSNMPMLTFNYSDVFICHRATNFMKAKIPKYDTGTKTYFFLKIK
jgi:hypothetical protein